MSGRTKNRHDCRTTSAADLVAALGEPAQLIGDGDRTIRGIAPLEDADAELLVFSKRALGQLEDSSKRLAGATVIVPMTDPADGDPGFTVVAVPHPRAYFLRAVAHLIGGDRLDGSGIAASADIHPQTRVPASCYVGAGATIGAAAFLGERCIVSEGVRILAGTELGDDVVIQPNAVLGCLGQSYERDENGRMIVMPHLAGLRVADRVRIGANTTIIRGTLRDTLIGPDTSIGNNVNIGHNVRIGARCFVGAGSVLGGSASIGDDAWVSMGAVVRGVDIGADVTVGMGAVVTRPVESKKIVNGFPAKVTATKA